MGQSALIRVSSFDRLCRAWERVRQRSTPRSRQSCGVDGETILDFEASWRATCRQLSERMRQPGGYRFSALQPFLIPKTGSNKVRIICAPTVRDRVVQRALVEYLSDGDRCGLQNSVSYGFLPGRSVEKAVKQAIRLRATKPWVYKTDITSFFDRIDRSRLADAIRSHVRDRSLHGILNEAAACEVRPRNRTQAKIIQDQDIRTGRGIRQGMPISPFFANLVLKSFDFAIEKAGIEMVRYADDLICLRNSEDDCRRAHDIVAQELARQGLTVPPPVPGSKTVIYEPHESAEFLGLSLRPESGHYVLEVSKEQSAKIRQKIADFVNVEQLQREGINISRFFRKLDGMIDGYEGAYHFATNAKHVSAMLESARHGAVTRLFEKELGVSLAALSPAKRTFLGVGS